MSTLNFNIGVLGHVDSGKTSLAKALSTVASTACFDKNPQSKQRGITLDLGFSSFTIQSNEILQKNGYDFVQYTLVDCPGHASLIKTIIGGAQIIDMMLLVIDITKGIQTQTAECLIIGEICCNKMLIVLNKLDLIEPDKRSSAVEKMSKRLSKTLENTKFANSPIVSVAASLPINENEKENQESEKSMLNMDLLINKLKEITFLPERNEQNGPFLYSVDHCFTVKGQGTVMTGTILNGNVKVNDTVEIPILKCKNKVKSIQVFRKPVDKAIQGDRCGICLANFDSKQFERGFVCSPGYVKNSYAVIIELKKIRHFKSKIESMSKFHISIGHETLLAKIELFSTESDDDNFNMSNEYLHVPEIDQEFLDQKGKNFKVYALIDFSTDSTNDQGVLCVDDSLLIGSKLDTDIHLNQCRIAFYGRILHSFTNKEFKANDLPSLKVYKEKSREGVVERKHDEFTIIGKSLFKKETNMDLFVGLKVKLSTGDEGVIESGFGQSGKFKIRIQNGLSQTLKDSLDKKTGSSQSNGPVKIILNFKRFIYDDKKKMSQ
ncbi:unnamed protein product [Brachionus calyciflorus]|uniref:Selenocysteine-specific elongation factor n=1 Tax=Brachionus calyciflorus TaxID=104777 RepID=A0A813M492_9BILA|nr:unnamed protein product [Brachionus calyciflorus]